ncbi:hypothetical protein MTO96_001615 [Rhipicephalus appendiculatus]
MPDPSASRGRFRDGRHEGSPSENKGTGGCSHRDRTLPANLLAGSTADPGPLRPTPAPRRSLLPPASSSRTSPPAATPAEPAEDPRDALITTLLAALRAVGEYLPSDHPMRSVCLQAASAQSGATTVD